jgi:hypothetical protein
VCYLIFSYDFFGVFIAVLGKLGSGFTPGTGIVPEKSPCPANAGVFPVMIAKEAFDTAK